MKTKIYNDGKTISSSILMDTFSKRNIKVHAFNYFDFSYISTNYIIELSFEKYLENLNKVFVDDRL